MSRAVFDRPRHFQIWHYSVSHRRLVLRSTKSAECMTRITVQFLLVSEIHLPTSFEASEIVDVSSALLNGDALREAQGLGRLRFEIRNRELLGYLCASGFVVHEDNLDYSAPAPFENPRPFPGDHTM